MHGMGIAGNLSALFTRIHGFFSTMSPLPSLPLCLVGHQYSFFGCFSGQLLKWRCGENSGYFRFLGNVEMWRREVYQVTCTIRFHCLLATAVDKIQASSM